MAHWHPHICASAVLILFEQETFSWFSQQLQATSSSLLDETGPLFYLHHIHAHTSMYFKKLESNMCNEDKKKSLKHLIEVKNL